MTLQEKLLNEIYYKLNKQQISHIIVNLITFKELAKEVGIPDDLTDYRFMGYKLYRSEDIEINKFIVG